MSDIIGNRSEPPGDDEDIDEGIGQPAWWSWRSLASPSGLAVTGLALGFVSFVLFLSAQPIGELMINFRQTGPGELTEQILLPAIVGALVAALGVISSALSVRASHGSSAEPAWSPAVARGGLAVSAVALAIYLTVIALALTAQNPAPGFIGG
jgi:hypothetical protein